MDLAFLRIKKPHLFERHNIMPTDTKELRELETFSMDYLKENFSEYHKKLRDEVFAKFTDEEGFYFSAESNFRSKNGLSFGLNSKIPINKSFFLQPEYSQPRQTRE